WPLLAPPGDICVKFRNTFAEGTRISADLIQRCEREINIKSGVFKAFGHDGARELLPSTDKREAIFSLIGTNMRRSSEEKHVRDKIKAFRGQHRTAFAGRANRAIEKRLRIFWFFKGLDVGPVYGQARGHLNQGFGQLGRTQFARIAIIGGEFRQFPAQRSHFDSEERAHDQLFLLIKHVVKIRTAIDPTRIDVHDRGASFAIDEQPIRIVQIVVTSGAFDGPIGRNIFFAAQDLFDNNVSAAIRGRICGKAFAQTSQIAAGIAQSVDVVYTKSGNAALRSGANDSFVSGVEYRRVLDAHTDQIRD